MPKGSGLLNLYRMIEAGEVELDEAPEPDPDLAGRLEPVFGCRPWTPARERARRTLTGLTPDGRVLTVEVCDVCGSGAGPVDRLTPETFCAACYRSLRDHKIAAILGRDSPRAS